MYCIKIKVEATSKIQAIAYLATKLRLLEQEGWPDIDLAGGGGGGPWFEIECGDVHLPTR